MIFSSHLWRRLRESLGPLCDFRVILRHPFLLGLEPLCSSIDLSEFVFPWCHCGGLLGSSVEFTSFHSLFTLSFHSSVRIPYTHYSTHFSEGDSWSFRGGVLRGEDCRSLEQMTKFLRGGHLWRVAEKKKNQWSSLRIFFFWRTSGARTHHTSLKRSIFRYLYCGFLISFWWYVFLLCFCRLLDDVCWLGVSISLFC